MKASVPPLNIISMLQLQHQFWEKQNKPVKSSVTAFSSFLEAKTFNPTSYATTLGSNADLISSGTKNDSTTTKVDNFVDVNKND
jgi:hypothetical protein